MKDQRKTKARLIKELATLRQSEERYRQLFESANDAIVSLTLDGIITTVNRGVEVLLSWSREEQIGRHYREFLTPSSVVFTEERAQRIQAGEKVSSIFEIELLRKDGSVVPVEARSRFIRDRQGKPIGVLASYRDITARKQAEAEKQELQEQLFQARKMEALGTLAGGVAHDFNNILSAIMGFTELATDEVPEGTVARRNLEEVLKASRRAKVLVQQILTFSRPSQPKSEPIQPHPIVEEVLTFLRASLPKTIEIHHDIARTVGPVAISASQLQQVLMNLCVNAIEALGEKGGVLEVHLERVKMENDFAHPQRNLSSSPYLSLTVRDTGCGMTPEVLERIFEPFFTTRPVGKGNGLGLAIVHEIVTGHGGAITVESTLGRGTTFHVYLPVSESPVTSENIVRRFSF